jgi:hypothetical protein
MGHGAHVMGFWKLWNGRSSRDRGICQRACVRACVRPSSLTTANPLCVLLGADMLPPFPNPPCLLAQVSLPKIRTPSRSAKRVLLRF